MVTLSVSVVWTLNVLVKNILTLKDFEADFVLLLFKTIIEGMTASKAQFDIVNEVWQLSIPQSRVLVNCSQCPWNNSKGMQSGAEIHCYCVCSY